MCSDGVACSPCAARAVQETHLVAVEQAEREVLVWGPASVEVESKDGFLFTTAAMEQALPQLLRRRTVDLFHKSAFGVGEVIPEITPQKERMPSKAALRRVVDSLGGTLRSDVYEVTQAIVDLFPRLKAVQGTRQLFLASRIFGDNDTSRIAQERALKGELDSYSVAGVAREVEQSEVCAPGGCREVQRILRLDFGAVTLCGTESRPAAGVPQAKNPLAGFVVVQMAHDEPVFSKSPAAPSPSSPPSHQETRMKTNPTQPQQGQPVAVQQAEDEQPKQGEEGASGGDPLQRLEKAAVDQGRRIEELEQTVAELRGASARSTTHEKEAEEQAAPKGEDDDTEDKDMPNDPKDEKKKDEKPVEQAQPAADAAPAWFQGFVATQLPTMVEQAVTKAMDAKAVAVEQATAPADTKAGSGARPSIAATPQPAAPATGQTAAASGAQKSVEAILIEAAESGNPAAFQSAWAEHGPTLRGKKEGK